MKHDPICPFGLKCKYINTSCIRNHSNLAPSATKQKHKSNNKKSQTTKRQNNDPNSNKNDHTIHLDNLTVTGLIDLCRHHEIDISKCKYREDYVKMLHKNGFNN